MSPFFDHEGEPFILSKEEQALLLRPTEKMFIRLFNTGNTYVSCSRFLGKMYAHISWANKKFSKTYLSMLGQFIKDSDCIEVRRKFKAPLMQSLLLEDIPSLVQLRAKIALKHIFSQLFLCIKDKYYVLALEIVNMIFHLAFKVPSINSLVRSHKDMIYHEILKFLEADPIVCLTQMQWVPQIPRNATTLDLNRRLLTSEIENMIRLNLMDKKNKLNDLFDPNQKFNFMLIEETTVSTRYHAGQNINFFSDKYKDWIHAAVIQEISKEVLYIE